MTEEHCVKFSFVERPVEENYEFQSCNEILTSFEQFELKEKVNSDMLMYEAGYVAYRFKDKYNLGVATKKLSGNKAPDWLQYISRGSLLYPNDNLLLAAKILDSEFHSFHGTTLSSEKKIFTKLTDRTLSLLGKISVPYEVLLCLSRNRTYIRICDINRKISYENCKRKLDKKMSKFTNFKK